MGITLIMLTFLVIWWLVLFAVLPWGVQPPADPQELHDPGAPEKPRLGVKFGVTTLLAGLLTALVAWAVNSPYITLGD